jgi:polysaccharide biosynthesis transport protein
MKTDGPNQPITHSRRPTTPSDHVPAPQSSSVSGGPLALPLGPVKGMPAGLTPTPTVGALLFALKRRARLASALAVAAAGLAFAAVAVVFPPNYVTQARLELASKRTLPVFTNSGEQEVDPNSYRANQQAIIKSPLVLASALASDKLKGLNISGLSVDQLEKNLKCDFTQGPEIMTIKLYGKEPDELAEMLNAIIQAYKQEIETRDNQRRGLLIKQLEKSLDENRTTLTDKRLDLRRVEKEQDVLDPITQQIYFNSLALKVTSSESILRLTRNELGKKQLDLAALKSQLEGVEKQPVSQAKLRMMVNNSNLMQQFAAKIAKLDEEITKLSTFPSSDQRDSKIDSLSKEKLGIQESASNTENALRPDFEKELRLELQESLDYEIRKLEGGIRALQIDEASLTRELEKVQAEFHALNPANRQGSVTVQKLRDDVQQIQKTQDTLANQVALLKAEPSASSKIVVLQSAETPRDMDYSRLVKYGSGGALAAFGLVLLGVAFLEFQSGKINGAAEVINGLSLPLVGTMPQLPARARRPVNGTATAEDLHWQSIITESVDAIRTQLLHAARTDAVQIVMVTSATGGEGKTSLASQLAASLARAWRKTLLVDGDLRNPAAHKLFDMPLEPGFSEVLRGEANVGEAVKPTVMGRLSLLPAGHWDAHAVQALAQDNVRATFDEMKEQFDFIVVDSCPVLPVADSLLLGQHVDAVIFSVLRDVSRLPALQAAQQKLQGLSVRVLGAVIIGADSIPGSDAYKYTTAQTIV